MSLRHFLPVALVLMAVLCAPTAMSAQGLDVERLEVFAGYSCYHAGGTVNNVSEPMFNKGWTGQVTYNLSHWAGITLDAAGHYNDSASAKSFSIGPQFRLRSSRMTPFAEALLGVQSLAPKTFPSESTPVFILGAGLDYPITPRFSVRPFQVDYVATNYDKLSAQGNPNSFNGVRLQAGLVFNFGMPAKQPSVAEAACSSDPESVEAGAPVRVSVLANGFLPRRVLSYSYDTNGGRIEADSSSATVSTVGLAPGTYTVSVRVVDNGKGRRQQSASCQTAFVIKQLPKHPPVLSISVNPASIVSGDRSTIMAKGSSPDGRPLNFACTSTAGHLAGNGQVYTLDTTGVPDSTVGIHCTVRDDRSLISTADAAVKVNVPLATTTARHIHAIEFKNDPKRPTRVDNQAKGELDRYADALAAEPDAKGVMVGYETSREYATSQANNLMPTFAALRAVNAKDYVTKERGVDPTRVEVRTGSSEGQKVELWIIPAGATFPAQGTLIVDEGRVKAIPRVALKPAKAKRTTHKKVAKKK